MAGFLLTRVGILLHDKASSYTTANILGATNNGSQQGATSTQQSSAEKALVQDGDQDGLPDREEIIYGTNPLNKDTDGDGFIDGEEILSGHDPLDINENPKTGPGTNPKSSAANFTDRLSDLAVANMVNNQGYIQPSNLNKEILADVVESAEKEMASYFYVPQMQDADIKISQDNSPENTQRYINTIAPIIEQNTLNVDANIAKSISTAGGITAEDYSGYRSSFELLRSTEVPSSWKEVHKQAMTMLLSMSRAYSAMEGDTVETDPLKAAAALNQIQGIAAQMPVLLSQISRLSKSQNIEIDDVILKIFQVK